VKITSKQLFGGLAVIGMAALSTSSLSANLLGYEGFATTASNGTDFSDVGVTGTGFSATTTAQTDFRMDIEDGLTYTDGFGNSLVTTGKSAGMEAVVSGTQNFQLGLNSPITNTGTAYMSFLVNVTDVSSWGVMTGLTDGVIGRSSSPLSSLEAALRSTPDNYGLHSDGLFDERTGPSTATGTYFFVAMMDMDAETMTGYINPTDLTDVENTSTVMTASADATWADMDTFIFSLGGQEAGTIDEIRLGTTMASVTPVPEPSLMALFFGMAALGGVVFRRRRRC
jgi:hypothetical protein